MTAQKIVVTLVCTLSLAAIFFITGNKVNQYGGGDSLLTLPTSQAIVQTGHTYLTQWDDRPITPAGQPLSAVVDNYQATRWNGEIIDVFSPGPALLTAPLVAIFNLLGLDLVDPDTNMAVQNRLAFVTSAVMLVSLFGMCLLLTDWGSALVISHVGFFGSSLFANMGLALFNLNYAAIFICWSLILLTIIIKDLPLAKRNWLTGSFLGVCLFLAFINRPSSVLLIFLTFSYLLLHHRPHLWPTMLFSAGCLILFGAWSQLEYSTWLPIYLNPAKTDDAILPLWMGLAGNLISPSRGMLVFMPWLIFVPMGLAWPPKRPQPQIIWWILAWFAGLLFLVSSSVIWWGGASFGPRVMAEIIPGLLLILTLTWNQQKDQLQPVAKKITVFSFCGMAIFSIWVNSYQPFFNLFTAGPWLDNITGYPVIDGRTPYFAWENSQWLANAEQVCDLNRSATKNIYLKNKRLFIPLLPDQPINPSFDDALNLEQMAETIYTGQPFTNPPVPAVLEGFLLADGLGSWSVCNTATVYFRPSEAFITADKIKLNFNGDIPIASPITLFLNGQPLAEITAHSAGQTIQTTFASSLLMADDVNTLTFKIPDNAGALSASPHQPPYTVRFDTLTLALAEVD